MSDLTQRVMTAEQLAEHERVTTEVARAATALHRSGCDDEDVRVALARLEEWLSVNEGRWTT